MPLMARSCGEGLKFVAAASHPWSEFGGQWPLIFQIEDMASGWDRSLESLAGTRLQAPIF